MAIKQYNQPNKPPHSEESIIHSRNSKNSLKRNDSPVNNSTSLAFLESINRYYGYLNYSEANNPSLRMMKPAGVLRKAKACADINQAAVSSKTIYCKLFNAFWNNVPWEDIFPSDTESARELKFTKNIIKDLILRHHGIISLQSVTNEFF